MKAIASITFLTGLVICCLDGPVGTLIITAPVGLSLMAGSAYLLRRG